MVTNGEYLTFLLDESEEDAGGIYEDSRIWQFVWSDSNFRVCRHKAYGSQGKSTLRIEEDYTGLKSFVDAFLDSIKFEIERVLATEEEDKDGENIYSQRYIRHEYKEVTEVIVFARFKLRHVLPGGQSDDWWTILSPKERECLDRLSKRDDVVEYLTGHIENLVKRLTRYYEGQFDPRLRKMLEKNPNSVETIGFLCNFGRAIRDREPRATVPFRKILFPRYWLSYRGDENVGQGDWFTPPSAQAWPGARNKSGPGPVPWSERPVVGITLYEALAYTAWLSHRIGWKAHVMLPNEAHYERAASWPVEPTTQASSLDLSQKSLYPWGNSQADYHDFFGIDGQSLESQFADGLRYGDLLNKTAKPVGDQQIEQLLGFGWQWTSDRFDARMPRYERLFQLPKNKHKDLSGKLIDVYDYQPHQHIDHANFVVRGAPYNLGGPGLTTRRFALFPLRAYPDVGFRWGLAEDEDA
jgi:hypothetical protein